MRLQQGGRAQKTVAVPPVARAAGGAAEAQYAFIVAVQLCPFFRRLQSFAPARCRCVSLQPWLDGLELGEGMALIADQILDHIQIVERIDSEGVADLLQRAGAGQPVGAVDVHGAGTTYALAAG